VVLSLAKLADENVKRIVLIWLTGVLTLAGLAQGQALAAVTVGSNLSNPPDNTRCFPLTEGTISCTLAQTSLPGPSTAPGGLTSPIDGVVVRWRIELGGALPHTTAAAGRLRVLRGDLGAGSSASENLLLSAGTYTFPTRLPVRSGDRIGLDTTVSGDSNCGGLPCGLYFVHVNAGAESTYDFWEPPLADGETRFPTVPSTEPSNAETELLLNADIEPDVDHDGFGDETQDFCNRDASTQGPCRSPGSQDFGSQTVGAQGAAKTVTLSNTSPTTALSIASISASGDFVVTASSCGAAIAAGASCAVGVAFKPTAAGVRGGVLAIADAANGSPHTVALSGTGVAAIAAVVSGASPVVSGASQTNARWREGNGLATFSRKRRPPLGTTFSFSLSTAATTTLQFTQRVSGRRAGKRCVAQTRRNRHKRKCTRTITAGTLSYTAHAGVNKVRFAGRISAPASSSSAATR
jgi:hypothetical protein